ncbi:MAG: response regulator [Alphaproteobacteria bacterium]
MIADDDLTIRTVLGKALSRQGYRVRTTAHAATLWHWASQGEGDLIITDVMMPDGDGLELVPSLQRLRPEMKIIVISAQNSLSTSAKAIELGVFGYLPKPFDLKELTKLVGLALTNNDATEVVSAHQRNKNDFPLIGNSPAIKALFRKMGKYAANDAPILITGGAGSGKTLAAKSLCLSRPKNEIFLIEDLDELDVNKQKALLKEVDEALTMGKKILSIASSNLFRKVKSGDFDQRLFDRLAVMELEIPNLDQRQEDITLLIEHFQNLHGSTHVYSPKIIAYLKEQKWPGNVRQLENLVRLLSVDVDQQRLELYHVEAGFERYEGDLNHGDVEARDINSIIKVWVENQTDNAEDAKDLHRNLVQLVERPLIENVLAKTRFNQIKASDILGLNRNTLRKKISELKILKPK